MAVVVGVKEAVKPAGVKPGAVKTGNKAKAFPSHAPNDFLEVKAAYPSKGSLQESMVTWDNLKPSPELCASLKAYATNCAAFSSEHTPWQIVLHLSRWLNGGRYDEPQSAISGFDDTKTRCGADKGRRTAPSRLKWQSWGRD